MVRLGVNIDHVATLRQQRREFFPDPMKAAMAVQNGGAEGIVMHLREDRRHTQDSDIVALSESVTMKHLKIPWSLEMAPTEEMKKIARVWATKVCLVPERREELTTEGGLDVVGHRAVLGKYILQLGARMQVSLFVDADPDQLTCAKDVGAQVVELHTGRYASAKADDQKSELTKLLKAAVFADKLKLRLHAGHGLDYRNVGPVAALPGMEELNIGFSIISHALFVGLETAVKQMKELLCAAS